MTQLVEVKSLGGTNFVRPDRVMAIQTTPTGGTVIVMEGGTLVNSIETTRVVATRLQAALLEEQDVLLERAMPSHSASSLAR